jgi:hypothetical protein
MNDAEVYVPPGALNPNWAPSFALSRAPNVIVFSEGPILDVPTANEPVIIVFPVTNNEFNVASDPDTMTFFQDGIFIILY